MFDQVCRREDTGLYLRLWTDDVQKPHDDFVRELRQNMSAIVEICWGEVTWRKLEKEVRLVQLPLWGKYRGVKLYLELEADGTNLKRFVFRMYHPQYFFRYFFRNGAATTRNGDQEKTFQANARAQDTALGLAASLVDRSTKSNFYEQFPRYQFPRLKKEEQKIYECLMESAREELGAAFSIEVEAETERRSRLHSEGKEKDQQIQLILQDLEKEVQAHRDPINQNCEDDELVSGSSVYECT